MNTVLESRDLVKHFGSVKAVDGLSLEVPHGSTFGIVGPNGSGKTTFFGLIAGFLRPSSGSFSLLGEADPSKVRGRFSILPQDARFQSNMPIVEQFLFYLEVLGWPRSKAMEEIERVLALVDARDLLDRPQLKMSHGQYKRLTVAQAFLGQPDLIVLDEPTTGLDLQSADNIRSTVRALKGNATVVISSHNMDEMNRLCDRLAVFKLGKLVSTGAFDELFRQSRSVTLKLDRPLDTGGQNAIAALEDWQSNTQLPDGDWRISWTPKTDGDDFNNRLIRVLMDLSYNIRSVSEDNPLDKLYRDMTKK